MAECFGPIAEKNGLVWTEFAKAMKKADRGLEQLKVTFSSFTISFLRRRLHERCLFFQAHLRLPCGGLLSGSVRPDFPKLRCGRMISASPDAKKAVLGVVSRSRWPFK